MKKQILISLILILLAGILVAQIAPPSDMKQMSKEMLSKFLPKPGIISPAKNAVLTGYEGQNYWLEWENDRKVQISYDESSRIHSLITRFWDSWDELWMDEERETVSYHPDGKVQQIIVEYWDGEEWFVGKHIDFDWDLDRLISIQHNLIADEESFPLMSQTYTYNEDDGRLEHVTTIMAWDFAEVDIYSQVQFEWDAMGRVQSTTMFWGDSEEWVPALRTEISYHSEDTSDYQAFMDFMLMQNSFGNHDLEHISSQIKVLDEIEFMMSEEDLKWVLDGRYEYIYDELLNLQQMNYYIPASEWDKNQDWVLDEQEDFEYDWQGNLVQWMVSGLYFDELEPMFRTLYSYSEPSSNPEQNNPVQLLALNTYPNPFNPHTTIAFELVRTEKVQLDIFNVKGQKVRSLLHGYKAVGKHQIGWDGRDDNGKALSSGIYYLRLSSGQDLLTRKMILQK